MKKIYLLTFTEFGGEKYCYFTDKKEWFDWIFTNDDKPLNSMVDFLLQNKKEINFHDISTREECLKFLSVNPKSGSFENDKALVFCHLCESAPDSSKELVKWLTSNQFEIDGEYDGMIY